MNTYLSLLIVVLLSIEQSHQDVYLHNPRGSNNRLNENTDARRNGARVFDSQVKYIQKDIFYLNL